MLKVKTGLIYLLALFAFYRRTVIDFVFRTKQIDVSSISLFVYFIESKCNSSVDSLKAKFEERW